MKGAKYLFLAILGLCLTAAFASSSYHKPEPPNPEPPDIGKDLGYKSPTTSTEAVIVLGDLVIHSPAPDYTVITVNHMENPDIWWDYYGKPILKWDYLSQRNGETIKITGHYGTYSFVKQPELTLAQYIMFREAWLISEGLAKDQNHAEAIILGNADPLSRKQNQKYKGNLARFDLPLKERRAIEDYVDWYSSQSCSY